MNVILSLHCLLQLYLLTIPYKNNNNKPHMELVQDWYKRKSTDKPFQTRDQGTDVIIKVERKQLYVHGWLLRNFSPTFQRMLNNDGSIVDDKIGGKILTITTHKAVHVIEYLQYFYPEFSKQVDRTSSYQELLELSEDYQTPWLTERIENHFLHLTSSDISSLGIKAIYLADKFNLHNFKNEILKKHLTMGILYVTKSEFTSLSKSTQYAIIRFKLKGYLHSFKKDILDDIFEILDAVFANQNIEEKNENLKKYEQEILFNCYEKSDVILEIGKYKVHTHRWLLCRLSPKLKEILDDTPPNGDGNGIKLDLFGMKPECIIEMLLHFYPSYKPKFTEKSPFLSLKKASDHFEVEWLTKSIENYIKSIPSQNVNEYLWSLYLTDHFHLPQLRSNLFTKLSSDFSLRKIKKSDYFPYLKHQTMFILVKMKMIFLYINNHNFMNIELLLNSLGKVLFADSFHSGEELEANAHDGELEANAQSEIRH